MRKEAKIAFLCVAAGLVAGATDRPAAAAPTSYSVTDLGTLSGDAAANGGGLNDSGQATGESFVSNANSSNEHAFSFSGGALIDLGTLGGQTSTGESINNQGAIAGMATLASGFGRAYVFQSGTMTNLGTLGGSNSAATAINDSGQVVGWSQTSTGAQHAFLATNGTMVDVGVLPGFSNSTATGINAAGAVVGQSTHGGTYHAFLYENGVLTDLGTLGGPTSGAVAINNNGVIIGWSTDASHERHSFIYSGGTMTRLGTFTQGSEAAYALNDAGLVVGEFYGVDSHGTAFEHAYIFDAGTFYDLNDQIPASSGWTVYLATAINTSGQILADATNAAGNHHAVLLTPTN